MEGPALRVLAGFGVIAVATLLYVPLRPIADPAVIALLYLFPVGLVAWVWGAAPGLFAGLCALLALDYAFVPPFDSFGISHAGDFLLVVAFALVMLIGAPVLNRAQASLRELRARQQELTHLYELMTALARLRSEDAIARTVAVQLQEAVQAGMVEVVFQPAPHREPESRRAPEGLPVPADRPDQVLPLMTPRGLLGEIHVWLGGAALSAPIDRLLKAAASQTALAFERVMLAQSETRAKVFEESDRMKSVLLSSVSHELRTPLATIKAAIGSLRSGAVSWEAPAREELLAAVEEETDHLNHLVGNLLDMSRIEAGALHPHRRWNVLADILAESLAHMRRAADGHVLEVDVPDDLPLAPVDEVQIGQVFVNLLDNSFKYAPAGAAVQVSAGVRDDALLVTVANQGPPVPEVHLGRIFDKFHRVTESDRVTGTGLGLSICKGIVEAHGGRLWAENLPPGGRYSFAFHFTLPLSAEELKPPRISIETEPTEREPAVTGASISEAA